MTKGRVSLIVTIASAVIMVIVLGLILLQGKDEIVKCFDTEVDDLEIGPAVSFEEVYGDCTYLLCELTEEEFDGFNDASYYLDLTKGERFNILRGYFGAEGFNSVVVRGIYDKENDKAYFLNRGHMDIVEGENGDIFITNGFGIYFTNDEDAEFQQIIDETGFTRDQINENALSYSDMTGGRTINVMSKLNIDDMTFQIYPIVGGEEMHYDNETMELLSTDYAASEQEVNNCINDNSSRYQEQDCENLVITINSFNPQTCGVEENISTTKRIGELSERNGVQRLNEISWSDFVE